MKSQFQVLFSAIVFLFFFISKIEAQNITITDDDNYSPENTAVLDVKSTGKGMLVPRLTTAQRTAISSPATGLLVFDTDKQSFYFNGAKGWTELTGAATENVNVNEALFAVVKPNSTDTVFAVYPEGVRIYVEDGVTKGNKGGFAVGGFDASKGTRSEYFRVTPDSARIYIDTATVTGNKGEIGRAHV